MWHQPYSKKDEYPTHNHPLLLHKVTPPFAIVYYLENSLTMWLSLGCVSQVRLNFKRSLPEFELYARPMSSDILIFTLSSEHFTRRETSFPSSFVYHDQGQIQTLQPTRNGFDRSMSLVQMCQAFLDLTIPSNHTKACTFLEVDGDQTLSSTEILTGLIWRPTLRQGIHISLNLSSH